MKFWLELESGLAAFDGDVGDREVARILHLVSDIVTNRPGILGGGFADRDGNTIGQWRHRRGRRQTGPPADG
jgi:hypothetical protein